MSNLIAEMQILLRKNKELQAERDKLLRTMNLHVGDICSLNNDVEYFRGLKEEAEDIECKIQAENKWLRKSLKQYGRHSDECRAEKYPEAWHCTCGLEQALAGKGSDK